MKAFDPCERRIEGKCIQSCEKCLARKEIDINKCWRMSLECREFLQCPDCLSRLWQDIYTEGIGFEHFYSLYCEKCNCEVSRVLAVQTFELLGKELVKCDARAAEHEKIEFMPGPRLCDEISGNLGTIKRIEKMVIALARKKANEK